MLKKFCVKNYKCFENLEFDLSSAEYSYNSVLVKNSLVNKALIFGCNGSGKTSLGIAVFDIILHLTDKEPIRSNFTEYYRNLNSNIGTVFFQYTFSFDGREVEYAYEKTDAGSLVYEKLRIDKQEVLDYHYGSEKKFADSSLKGNLDINLPDNKLSVLKYIYRNTPTGKHPVLAKLIQFCEGMLWFRSSSDGNAYCGLINGRRKLDDMLYESGKTGEFQDFLKDCGLHYTLGYEENGGTPVLYAYFRDNRKAPFSTIASQGTKSLFLFFVWLYTVKEHISFLFIDEFDAFFHYETAQEILTRLNEQTDFQSMLTTHDTYLMQNRFTRPDCCFILSAGGAIKSLKNSSQRELREAHNLEKLYINGAFAE